MYLLLIVLFGLIYYWQRKSLRRALEGIEYDGRCNSLLVEPREAVEFSSRIGNRSRRLVTFLKLVEEFPAEAEITRKGGKVLRGVDGECHYLSTAYLLPRSKLIRRTTLRFSERGCYEIPAVDLVGGDLLGLKDFQRTFPTNKQVVVYPPKTNLSKLQDALGGFMGEVSVRRFIMEDPVLTVGAREYTGSEPLKQMSWGHTARTGRMMVKQFDYTAEPMVSVLVDINMTGSSNLTRPYIESCYSLARSVCEQLEERKMSYDFAFNMWVPGFSEQRYLPFGSGNRHYSAILELLGRATHQVVEPFHQTARQLFDKQSQHQSTIIITPQRDGEKNRIADQLLLRLGGTKIMLYGEDFHDIH